MKKDNLLLYVSVIGLFMAFALLMVAVGVMANALGLLAGGLVLFVLALWVPVVWFVASVARRLDVLAETGNDWTPFNRNRGAEAEKQPVP